jgi:hypothetical protein
VLETVSFSSHPRPFKVASSCCQNIECPCAEALFTLYELGYDAQHGREPLNIQIRVDPMSWQEIDPPARSPEIALLVREFLDDYPQGEKAEARQNADWKAAVAARIRDHRFDAKTIRESTLVSFRQIAFGDEATSSESFLSAIEMDGSVYLVDDLYCPNPDCDCQEAQLVFYWINRATTHEPQVKLTHVIRMSWPFNGRSQVHECLDCTPAAAQRLMRAWLATNEGLLLAVKWRYERVKEIARRSGSGRRLLHAPTPPMNREPAEPARVGRNAPCPCGSGRKFKKCCGQTLLIGN